MATGKRLAKRSIIGTRVCAPGRDKLWYSGVIQKVKTPPSVRDNNCITLTPDTKYTVRFDPGQTMIGLHEYLGSQLIGPGFQNVMNVILSPGQKIFITYNGRESAAEVLTHDKHKDEVAVRIPANGFEVIAFDLSTLFYSTLSGGCRRHREWIAPRSPPSRFPFRNTKTLCNRTPNQRNIANAKTNPK